MALIVTACDHATVYHHYEHTPAAGWEKNDTLVFDIPPLADTGTYQQEVGLRITNGFPFMSIHLIIEQTNLTTHEQRSDTLKCSLINEQGVPQGDGVSQYQYLFPLNTQHFDTGTPLRITLRHDMKREILPGITDVGIRLSRQPSSRLSRQPSPRLSNRPSSRLSRQPSPRFSNRPSSRLSRQPSPRQ
ncbi:MAG: gliding motility lipoprotein GldH [Prevotella sp.]|nr:gliding motility lipoprotein GldH [Prevotella sp.]